MLEAEEAAAFEEGPDPSLPDPGLVRLGTIEDFVSGQQVRATPEEVEAVQVMARRLVQAYGYPKTHLRTRPQWRVRHSPSGSGKSYPVDIAVFSSPDHREDNLLMVVECKRKTRKDGLHQLQLYLDMCRAELGAWFNGRDRGEYRRKVLHPDGSRSFEELPDLPRFGQRIEDIGLHQRRHLSKPSNLKSVFREIRNHLAGNAVGMTRDEALAQEVINLLFCKIYDEVATAPQDIVKFRWGHNEEPHKVEKRILDLFHEVKVEYPDVFDEADKILGSARTKRHADIIGVVVSLACKIESRAGAGEIFLGETVERNLHFRWRELCAPVDLPADWTYSVGGGEPYPLFRLDPTGTRPVEQARQNN